MQDRTRQIEFPIEGLSCAACVGRAERALSAVPGVAAASVNLATRRARVTLDDPAALAPALAALDHAGYPAARSSTRLSVEGMSCAACTGRVERALAALPGVTGAAANLATRSVTVEHLTGVTPAALAGVVTRAGYPATVPQAAGEGPTHRPADETGSLRHRLILAALLTLPVFVAEMGGHLVPPFHHWLMAHVNMRALWLAEMVLTAAVLAGPGRVFLSHGIPALLRGAPEMNSLVALGAGAAFLYSAVVTLAPALVPPEARHVYFEAAAVIVTLILMGRWLESRARGQAGQAIRRLLDLAPPTARVLRAGVEAELPVAELVPGDLVRLLPGERVAVDGEVVEGEGSIDESMLTGEPVPAPKSPGDAVTGGTVNGPAALVYRVTATGEDTALARIIRLVEDAQGAKLPVQALVDRVTRVFVPVVMALAGLAFVLWMIWGPGLAQAVVAGVAVLIIACPCAMGLAVPVSIMVGTGRGAELGILFRRGDALQRLAGVELVAFDKTGTLTEGRPVVTGILELGGADIALPWAAALEQQSGHPLAHAIIAEAAARGATVPQAQGVTALPGQGLRGVIAGHEAALLAPRHVPDLPEVMAREWARVAAEGASGAVLTVDGAPVALFDLADAARPGAAPAIAALHRLGVETAMISGDSRAAAGAVAARLGIDRVSAEVLPEGKVAALAGMAAGRPVAFVGDGINDAPVLAAADVGIAIGSGTDVAIEAAEVVLVSGDPQGAARAVRLSRAVMRNIRQNLFWAFAYNAALIPVAMGALVPFGGPQLSPMLGAGAMALSSVFVVTNALRLRRFA